MRLWLALAVAAALAAGVVFPASGQVAGPRWSHKAAGGENVASYKERGVELLFRCLGGAVELALYVDTPVLDPDVRGRPSAFFALIVDDQIFSFQGKLIVDGNTSSIGSGGRTANDFAHFIAGASRQLSASVLNASPGPGSLHYNLTQLPVEGAADSIKAAYAGCGIPF